MKRTGRDIDRDRRELEREEKKLVQTLSHLFLHFTNFFNYRKWKLRMLPRQAIKKHAQYWPNS